MLCPICSNADAVSINQSTRDAFVITCHHCGEFTISRSAVDQLAQKDKSDRWKISAWINEFKPEFISSAELETVRTCSVPSLHHRAERMLRWIAAEFSPGKEFTIQTLQHQRKVEVMTGQFGYVFTGASRLIPIGWNKTIQELSFMLNEVLCKELGWIVQSQTDGSVFKVSPKGLLHIEGWRESASSVGFCAMWFNPSVRFIYDEAISKAIKDAGYEPFRVDGKEHNNRIDDEIVANIKSAKFMVADLTGHRGGVYYEAGLAHGLGLEVIFTCKEKRATHFDIRQYNTIFWNPNNMADFREKIKNRILASSIGKGPLNPNRT
jgi:hypothetical protein